MNKIYKVQYNDALGTWVAVPEIAKGRSKSTSSAEHAESTASLSKPGKWALTTLAAALLPMLSGQAFAVVSPPKVVSLPKLVVSPEGDISPVSGSITGANCVRDSTSMGNKSRLLCGSSSASADTFSSVSIGYGNAVGMKYSVLYGSKATVKDIPLGEGAVAIGYNTNVEKTQGIAIGQNAHTKGEKSIVLGADSISNGTGNVLIGNSIDNSSINNVNNSVFLGNDSTYIGLGTDVKLEGGEILVGSEKKKIGYEEKGKITTGKDIASLGMSDGEYKNVFDSKTTYAGANNGVLSIGTKTKTKNDKGEEVEKNNTRRLQGLSAGALTAGSTDAINGSQLYYTNEQVSKNKDNIKTNKDKIDDGWNAGVIAADGGEATPGSVNIQLGDTLNYAAGSNIKLTATDKKDKNPAKIEIATKDNVTFKTVNITEGGTTIMDGQDIKVEKKNGKVVIDKTTNKPVIVDKDGNKIQGDNSLDIVNVKYVKDNASNVASTDGSVTVKLYEGKQFLTEKDKDGNILKDKSGNIIYKTDSAGNKIVDPNFPSEGKNFDIAVNKQAVVDGAQLPVVYTTIAKNDKGEPVDQNGNVIKIVDGKPKTPYVYKRVIKKGDKFVLKDAPDTEISNGDVIASMNNADGDVNSAMKLNNIAKGTQASDAGNVAQLNDILAQLGNPDDQSASVPKIGTDGSVEGLEYYLTSGDPSKENLKALDGSDGKTNSAEAYKKLYDEQYTKLKKENDALPKDKQKPDEKLKKDAAKFAMATAESKGYGKVVNSVGAAISNLDKAVNQAITVKANDGAIEINQNTGKAEKGPDSQGVYLGGGFSILGGNTEVKEWDDATQDYKKDKTGEIVTKNFENISTTINKDGEVKVALKEEITIDKATMNSATVNNVDGTDGKSVVNVDYLNEHATDQMPVVYTDTDGKKVYLTIDPATNERKFSKNPDGTEPVDTAEVVATMQTPKGTTEIAKGDEGTAKTEIVTKDAKKPNGARDIKLASPVSSDPITISVDDDGNYNRVQLSPDAQEKTTALNNIASVGDYTKVENAAKAVNGADLNNAIAGVLSYVDQTKATGEGGWSLMGDDQSTVEEVNPKGTVQIKGDGNITVGVQKSGDIVEANVELNSKLKNMEKIEFVPGDDGKSSSVSISKNGIKAGEKKITNVADGAINASSHDAVNGSQLYRLKQDIDNIDNRASAGTAAAMATAGLSQVYLPGKSMVSAAASHYRGQSAIAVGLSTISDNGKWIIKGAANANKEDLGVTVGVGYMW